MLASWTEVSHECLLEKDGALFDPKIRDRFFVEAGAYDGVVFSNSILLELKHKWTGLLVDLWLLVALAAAASSGWLESVENLF